MDYNSKIVMLKGADGAGITDIKKTSTNALTDTYTITLSDGQKHNFDVTNGKGISNISKTGTSGLVDTYTITYNDGTTSTFTVTNGEGVQNLQVGGRNLLTNSKGEFSSGYLPEGDNDIVKYTSVHLPTDATHFVLSFEAKSTVEEDGIISFFFEPSNVSKTEVSSASMNPSHGGDGNVVTYLTTEWKRYWIKWTAPVADTRNVLAMRLNKNYGTGTVSMRNVKFEVGTTPTDWTPAPEDLTDTSITNSEIDTILNS